MSGFTLNPDVAFVSELRLASNEYGRSNVVADFTSVQEAARRATDPSVPIVIYGDTSYEVISSYVHSLIGQYSYRSPLIDSSCIDLLSQIRHHYRGRSSTFRRIENFLGDSEKFPPERFSDTGILQLANLPRPELYAVLSKRFVETRRKPGGAQHEIDEFFNLLNNEIICTGPCVLRLYPSHGRIAYRDLIALSFWAGADPAVPLVIALESEDAPSGFSHVIERQYISLEEGLHFIAGLLGSDVATVRKASDLIRKINTYAPERLLTRGVTTLYYLDRLRDFVPRFSAEESLIQPALPRRIAAPIMFDEREGQIALDRELVSEPNRAHTIGAARGLRNLCEDLLYSGILANVSPQATRVLSRIMHMAERIGKDAQFGDSDIIELGVDCAAIEAHVYKSQEKIIESSQGELLAFISESRRFLQRFESWRTYDAESHDPNRPAVDSYMAGLAIRLLESASEENLLSDEAKNKVIDSVSTAERTSPQAEGDVQSAENLLATVGRAALRATKKQALHEGAKVFNEQSDQLAERALHFVNEHAACALELAQTRGSHWLEMLVRWFQGGN